MVQNTTTNQQVDPTKDYIGFDVTTGKKYDAQSRQQSQLMLSEAQKYVTAGDLKSAQNSLVNFATFSGIKAPDLKEGWFKSPKIKQNTALLRSMSDNYNAVTISRYREEAIRRGNFVTADQYLQLFNKAREASVNQDAAIETSEYLDEVLSRARRSDNITGITDVALTKLDAIRLKHMSSGKENINTVLRESVDALNKSEFIQATSDVGKVAKEVATATGKMAKDAVGGAISNITGMIDLIGHLYASITGTPNPIETTKWVSEALGIDQSSWSYLTGGLYGMMQTLPFMTAARVFGTAPKAYRLSAAINTLAKSSRAMLTQRKIIGLGMTLASMEGAKKLSSEILEAVDINENRRESLPHVFGAIAGAGGHYLTEKIYSTGSSVKEAKVDYYKSMDRNGNPTEPSPSKQSFIKSVKTNMKLRDLSEKTYSSEVTSRPAESSFENNVRKAGVEAARKEIGKNFDGATVYKGQITELNAENAANGAENSAKYARTISETGKLNGYEIDPIAKANALEQLAEKTLSKDPVEAVDNIIEGFFVDPADAKPFGLDKTTEDFINIVNSDVIGTTETIAKLANKEGAFASDIIRSIDKKGLNIDLVSALDSLADVQDKLLLTESKKQTTRGLIANKILKDRFNAMRNVLQESIGIDESAIRLDRLASSEYTSDIYDRGISEANNMIRSKFNKRYEPIFQDVTSYYEASPYLLNEKLSVIKEAISKIDVPTSDSPEGATWKYKPAVQRIARYSGAGTPQNVVNNLLKTIEITKDNKIADVVRALPEIKNYINEGVLEYKTISERHAKRNSVFAEFKRDIADVVNSEVKSAFSDALGKDAYIYNEVSADYSRMAEDRSLLNADKLNTSADAYQKLISNKPQLINNYLRHIGGETIDPQSDLSVFNQMIKAKAISPMLEVDVANNVNMPKEPIMTKYVEKNRIGLQEILTDKEYQSLVEISSLYDKAIKPVVDVADLINSGEIGAGLSQDEAAQEAVNIIERETVKQIVKIGVLVARSAKKVNVLPIGGVGKAAFVSKYLLSMFDKISDIRVKSQIDSLTGGLITMESHPQLKGQRYYKMSQNIKRNRGFDKSSTKINNTVGGI